MEPWRGEEATVGDDNGPFISDFFAVTSLGVDAVLKPVDDIGVPGSGKRRGRLLVSCKNLAGTLMPRGAGRGRGGTLSSCEPELLPDEALSVSEEAERLPLLKEFCREASSSTIDCRSSRTAAKTGSFLPTSDESRLLVSRMFDCWALAAGQRWWWLKGFEFSDRRSLLDGVPARRRRSGEGFRAGEGDTAGLALLVWKKKDSPWKETERLRVVVQRALAAAEGPSPPPWAAALGRPRSTEWERLGPELDEVGSGEGARREVEVEVEEEEEEGKKREEISLAGGFRERAALSFSEGARGRRRWGEGDLWARTVEAAAAMGVAAAGDGMAATMISPAKSSYR